jgi:hypothetical protein
MQTFSDNGIEHLLMYVMSCHANKEILGYEYEVYKLIPSSLLWLQSSLFSKSVIAFEGLG